LRWNEMRMATLTTAMYIASRNHERNAKITQTGSELLTHFARYSRID